MILKFKKSKKIIFLIFLTLPLLLPFEAQAVAPALVAFGIFAGIPMLLGLIKGLAAIILFIPLVGVVNLLAGRLLDLGIVFQNIFLDPERITVIQTTWGILRDFVNIFFILILLIIAFATIFNIKNYKASDLLPKLIIAALLINFSLVVAVWAIDLLWVPAAVFLKPLGQEVSGGIVNALNIGSFFNPKHLIRLIQSGAEGVFVEAIIRSIILVINAFMLSWMALIILARIPVLIGLMIISPLAWLGLTLPAIKKQSWDTWWQKLFCWGAIPIPLFGLIYFVIFFNQRLKTEISQAASDSILNLVLPYTGFTIGEMLIWLITFGLFLGGMMYIKGLSCSLYGWVNTAAWGLWGGIRKGTGRAVDYGYAAWGYKGGLEQVRKGIEREGIPIFGKRLFGTAAREAREAKIAERWGLRAGLPDYMIQTGIIDQEEKVKKDLENKLKLARTPDEEKEIIEDAFKKGLSSPEGLAGFMLLAKRGDINAEQIRNAMGQLKDMPLVLSRVFSEWKEGKFGGVILDDYLDIMKDKKGLLPLEARRMMYSFAASEDGKRVAEKMNQGDFDIGAQLLGKNTKSGRDYFKFWGDFSPTYVAKYRFDHIKEEGKEYQEKVKTLQDAIKSQIEKASVKDVGDYVYKEWVDDEKITVVEPDGTIDVGSRSRRFKDALKEIIVDKNNRGTATQFVGELRRKFRREGKDTQLEELNKLLSELGINIPEVVYRADIEG